MRIDCAIYKEVDEIDHLTIRCRRGEPMDRKTAAAMIKRYTACFADVKEAFANRDTSLRAVEALDDRTLYDWLVEIRTVLMRRVF
jgi:hypothetical protein